MFCIKSYLFESFAQFKYECPQEVALCSIILHSDCLLTVAVVGLHGVCCFISCYWGFNTVFKETLTEMINFKDSSYFEATL